MTEKLLAIKQILTNNIFTDENKLQRNKFDPIIFLPYFFLTKNYFQSQKFQVLFVCLFQHINQRNFSAATKFSREKQKNQTLHHIGSDP